MHEISTQTIQLAQQHAKIADKHGRELEQRGILLQQIQASRTVGRHIEERGQEVQKHAQACLTYAQKAEQSTGELNNRFYELAVLEHSRATEIYTEAIKELSQIAQVCVDASKQKIQQAQETVKHNSVKQ